MSEGARGPGHLRAVSARRDLHKEPLEKARSNGDKLHWERFHLGIRNKFVCSENHHWQAPRGCGGVSVSRGFHGVVG